MIRQDMLIVSVLILKRKKKKFLNLHLSFSNFSSLIALKQFRQENSGR